MRACAAAPTKKPDGTDGWYPTPVRQNAHQINDGFVVTAEAFFIRAAVRLGFCMRGAIARGLCLHGNRRRLSNRAWLVLWHQVAAPGSADPRMEFAAGCGERGRR